MTRVLFVGQQPETVDFTNPMLPPGNCVVIGAGIRLPPHSLSMFEAVINAVHRAAPDAFSQRAAASALSSGRVLNAIAAD
jgi:hypothetical protein